MSHGERLLGLWQWGTTPDLDEAVACVAGIGRPEVDVDRVLVRLDQLAEGVEVDDCAHGIVEHVFGRHGFTGDRNDYYDPSNSRIDEVLDRRLGIPITLAVVVIEVGRRNDVPIEGVGFPGHFLLRDGTNANQFFDPFDPARSLDRSDCEDLFEQLHGPKATFDASYLACCDPSAIITRVLNNLRYAHRRRSDARSELEVLRVLSRAPTAGPSDAYDYACALADRGRFGEAVTAADPYRDFDERIGRSIDRWLAHLN
jgi:regulator of sirC expression with transglutaminase-like and TPR domain